MPSTATADLCNRVAQLGTRSPIVWRESARTSRKGASPGPRHWAAWRVAKQATYPFGRRSPPPAPAAGARRTRCGLAPRRHLGTADDHHEELIRAVQSNRRPPGHRCASQVMTQVVRDVGREPRRDTQAEQPPRQRRNRRFAARRIQHHPNSRRSGHRQ
jgi:hypothetical protein